MKKDIKINLKPEIVCPVLNPKRRVEFLRLSRPVSGEGMIDLSRESEKHVTCTKALNEFAAGNPIHKRGWDEITAERISDSYLKPIRLRISCQGCKLLPEGFSVTKTIRE